MDENNNLENLNNLNNNNNGNIPPEDPNNPYYNPYFQNDNVNNMADNNMNMQENEGVNQVLENQMTQEPKQVEQVTDVNDDSLNLFGLDDNQQVDNSAVTNQILSNDNVQEVDNNNINNMASDMAYQNQEPMQNGFDTNMNYQEPMQNGFDANINYQEPMQNGFDTNMNYQEPMQNNMNYQDPIKQNNDNYQSPYNTKKKGNKLVPIILGIVIAVVVLGAIAMLLVMPKLSSKPQANESGNDILNEPVNYEFYNFYNDFGFDYDPTIWTLDEESKSLNNGSYKLSYAQSLEGLSSAGFDINTANGRSSLFTFLYNQFSSQTDATTAVELGTSNFTLKDNNYYGYIDLVATTTIERCYFVLLPEEDMFIEFILSNQDTIIPDGVNTEVLDRVCSIYRLDESEVEDGNTVGNEISNDIDENNIVDANTIGNDVINETITNEVNANETSSGNEIIDGNATTNNNATGTNGGIILTPPANQ